MKTKLNLGCGRQAIPEFLNVDKADLPGVDLVYDLSRYPWPLPHNHFEFIWMSHVLEHLPDTARAMEELWRILKPGGKVLIRVPFWNSYHAFRDPTHYRTFHSQSFDYYDPASPLWNQCNYYTHAQFKVVHKGYSISLRGGRDDKGWYQVKSPGMMKVLDFLAQFSCGIIYFLEVELEAIK